MSEQIRPAILSVLVLTLLCGCGFPCLLFAITWPLFPRQTGGSLIMRGGAVIGSDLIGQQFTRPEYFQSRPSAAGAGYDGTSSGGTNLGPNNPKLKSGAADFAGIRQLAAEYRTQNGLRADAPIPIDAVTRSGSGLDPHITPANAALQIRRVARARGLSEEAVRRRVADHTEGRQFGFLGSPRVPVLELNLALDQMQQGGPSTSH
ncbi:MAG: potassium-transporting ATPase subunit KdpC [Acidobacteriia bacterium]|nr:potassium-transporting ATPase subunit KdpC [Terriglobia bacterium]